MNRAKVLRFPGCVALLTCHTVLLYLFTYVVETMAPPYMDVRIAPLNPCSIETIPIPIRLANGKSVWPMITSYYELTNNTTTTTNSTSSISSSHPNSSNSIGTGSTTIVSSLTQTETSSLTQPSHQSLSSSNNNDATSHQPTLPDQQQQQHRVGHMDISLIAVPDNIARSAAAMPLQFDKSPTILPQPPISSKHHTTSVSSGILDGQWRCMPSYMIHHQQEQHGHDMSNQNYCFVSAHSNGEIQLHSFQVFAPNEYTELDDNLSNDKLFDLQFLSQSTNMITSKKQQQPPPLCLSIRWDTSDPCKSTEGNDLSTTSPTRIVSTYSNGTMAIHDVTTTSNTVQLIEHDRWDAHSMYPTNTPAEVWTASFIGDSTNNDSQSNHCVWTGGDDSKLKIWDIRSTLRPMLSYHDLFDAGITCISPHPTNHNIVAVGSYDETVLLIDTRYMSRTQPFWKSNKLGGGIWRMKWHPYTSNRLLVGAMHGGCCVLNFYGTCLDSNYNDPQINASDDDNNNYHSYDKWTMKCSKYFTEHESMVYGADWLVCPHPTQNGYFEAAASCSFYDRAVYIWDSVY